MVHTGHTAHISHSQAGRFTQLRHERFHTLFWGQCRSGIARTPHGFGEDGVGLLTFRADDHIVGFRHTDPELVHTNRLNVVAISLHNGHVQTGDPDIKVSHRRGVDETQPNAFARLKKPSPVLIRPFTVDQPCKTLQVLDIRFHHPHATPGHTVPNGVHQAVLGHVREKLSDSLLLAVVVVRHHLQVTHDAITGVRVLIG